MAGLYGDFVAKTVQQGSLSLRTTEWTPLIVGSAPLEGRRHVRIQVQANPGGAVALAYAPRNADRTFTTPTQTVGSSTIMAGNTTWIEPVGDVVQMYGKLVKKAGYTSDYAHVVITEFA